MTTSLPLQPESTIGGAREADELLLSLSRLGFPARLLVAVLLSVVGVLVFGVGVIVASTRHWLGYLAGLLVFEPLVLFLGLLGFYCLAPMSILGTAVSALFRRARAVMLFILLCMAGATITGLIVLLWFAFRST